MSWILPKYQIKVTSPCGGASSWGSDDLDWVLNNLKSGEICQFRLSDWSEEEIEKRRNLE